MAFRGVRRVLFQIHLWTGLILGLYVLLISVTGSAVVFRREVSQSALRGLERGAPLPVSWHIIEWLVDLHDNLLSDRTGRTINGIGGLAFTLLVLSGVVIWWRGAAKWFRGLLISRRGGWRRFTFDLHGALGIWMLAFLLLWGISGIYFAFPTPFQLTVDYFEPVMPETGMRAGDHVVDWMVRLHFGRFGGLTSRVIWTILGLVPAVLFVSGIVLWWTRVRAPRRSPTLRSPT